MHVPGQDKTGGVCIKCKIKRNAFNVFFFEVQTMANLDLIIDVDKKAPPRRAHRSRLNIVDMAPDISESTCGF